MSLTLFNISNNQISDLPVLSSMVSLTDLYVTNNSLDFGDIEPNIGVPNGDFGYCCQANVGIAQTVSLNIGQEFRASVSVGGTSNNYEWFKNNILIPGSGLTEFVIPSVVYDDGGVYTCRITNTVAPDLTLWSNPITLVLPEPPVNASDSLALVALYNQCNGVNWTKKANWLTGKVSTWEGVSVENQRVVELVLGDWNTSVGLTGPIPSELANLTEIRTIWLFNNQLTGPLPLSWSTLVHLQQIDLSQNQLSGTLPVIWSELTNLQYLFLYSNQITGTLPGSWSNLSNLQRINIENNQLTGTIPDSWSGLLNLKGLSLGWNQLTGILPVSWSALVNMEDLILSGNQFTGNLPGSWSSMVNLRSISLYYNQLTGSLPDSWSSMVYLYHINIGNNQLTGVLPDSWSSMVNMGSLHFYNNMISGDFPASWSSMIYWWYFNLDNNRISGLPDLSTFSRPGYLYIKQNSLDFGDIEPNIGIPQYFFGYNPQAPVGETRTVSLLAGQEFRTSVSVGGSSNQYTWYKNDIPVPMSNSPEFVIPSVVYDDNGVYKCSITNTVATDLTLWSNPVTLVLPELPVNETAHWH
jgi:Leucine-rich repeat (LRR) protein